MKVDAYLLSGGPAASADHAARAHHLGYDGVMVAEVDHDPFLAVASAASAAPGCTLGTAIAVAFARSPMTLAYTAWDLAELTGGRFILGLGSQVRPHIVHRFSMPWSAPAPRMREFIAALRAIWASWQDGAPLRFRGEHYSFALMTPVFDPGPIAHPNVPIALAGVGEGMSRLAGEVADGFHVHPFHTLGYLDTVAFAAIADGARRSGRRPDEIDRLCGVMIATGRTPDELAAAADGLRRQISFYASTPSYRGVLEHEGWDIGDELNALSRRGAWDEMAGLISDEMVHEIATVALFDDLADAVLARYDGVLDRVGFYPAGPLGLSDDEERDLVAAVRGQ